MSDTNHEEANSQACCGGRSKRRVNILGRSVPFWLVCVVVELATLGAGAGIYFGFVYVPAPKNWGEVVPGKMYRSGLMDPRIVKGVLAENKIRVIVTMCSRETDDPEQMSQEAAARELGIEIKRFPMKGDGTTLDGTMNLHVEAIPVICKALSQGKVVLVQCAAGANRTGTMVAAYQLLVERKTPREVYQEMRRHKFEPVKNRVMLDFLNRNMKDCAEKLVKKGVIPSVPADLTIPDAD